MADPDSVRPISALPAEIWIIILGYICDSTNLRDLTHVWTDCRHISKLFKGYIELNFGKEHLPATFLNFDITYGWGPPFRYNFDRLSDDSQHAIFVPWCGSRSSQSYFLIHSKLARQATVIWLASPGQTVQIRRDMNDILIPDVGFDTKNGEMTVDWKALYTSYFTEERLFARLYSKVYGGTDNPWDAEKNALVAYAKVESEEESMDGGLSRFWHACHTSRNEARRMRLAFRCVTITGQKVPFDHKYLQDERMALNVLYNARSAAAKEKLHVGP